MPDNSTGRGTLQIYVSSLINYYPIPEATIVISSSDTNYPFTTQTLTTDSSGFAIIAPISTPAEALSETPGDIPPYSLLSITVTHPLFESITVNNIQILPDIISTEYIHMIPNTSMTGSEIYNIGPNVLLGGYPPHIPEAEVKDVSGSGLSVLESVKIPEYIIVHDGAPNEAATDYWVPYKDYIKNVASSEIYATWPTAAIYANVLAIQSFTLNRVYTEWYRGKGKSFTITSSTAVDHKWIPGRNFYDTIEECVDNIFNNYISKPGIKQPILTQYCDGKRVSCPGNMTQWGSKELADQGYSAIQILRYFYGSEVYINSAEQISGVPVSFPHYNLTLGTSGAPVRTIQKQLNTIATAYPLIPRIAVDGIYGPDTKRSVETFQQIFGMPVTGVVDFATWYKISQLYVGVSKIA
ncbi:MAG: peptidoglycan-binding protein [Clostridiales bacterium]|nr:peptidoglycan-binding protein [Clostridiales bacterium]